MSFQLFSLKSIGKNMFLVSEILCKIGNSPLSKLVYHLVPILLKVLVLVPIFLMA